MNFVKVGALWFKEGKNGKYLSGMIEINGNKHKIIVQKNNYKKEEKHPDYQISMMEEEQRQEWKPPTGNTETRYNQPITNDEIPF